MQQESLQYFIQAVFDRSQDLTIDLRRKLFSICLNNRDAGVLITYFKRQ